MMKISFQIWVVALASISLICFYSCEDQVKTLDDSLFDYEYFPTEVGKYWLYQVDSTVIYNQGSKTIKSKTFVREEVTEIFNSLENLPIYRIERSISDSIDGNYIIKDVWTAEKTEFAAFRTEENLRFNKMIFPLRLDQTWKGNLFDNLTEVNVAGEMIWVYKDWGDYTLKSKGLDRMVNGILYNDVATIIQADHDFAIERRFAIEHYAPGIGLIEKEMMIFDTQCECPSQTWEQKATSGYTMKQILLESN